MNKGFYYIVVEIGGKHYFIDKDMDYTDDFDKVLQFQSHAEAEDHIQKHNSEHKSKIIKYD